MQAHCESHGGNFEPAIKENKVMALLNRPLVVVQEEIKNIVSGAIAQSVISDTLVLSLSGAIEQKTDTNISLEKICAILRTLDSGISRVVFSFDSPGGSVDGVKELIAEIENGKQKGIKFIALSNPLCCSGAYWIASACNEVYLASLTSRVGSVGVVAIHEDISLHDLAEGKRITEVIAGKYKRVDTEHKPLSPEGKAILQEQVDYIYSLFVEDVSKNRGIPTEKLADEIGGKILIGQQAVDAGLADGIMSLNGLLERKEFMAVTPNAAPGSVPSVVIKTQGEMDMEMLRKENEDLKKRIAELEQKLGMQEQEAKAAMEKEKKCAAEAERARIKALDETIPASSVLSQAKSEGWTVEKASFEYMKSTKGQTASNPLRAESRIVSPAPVQSKSDDDERAERSKRMANYANSKIRS